jgi:hypothetical protein
LTKEDRLPIQHHILNPAPHILASDFAAGTFFIAPRAARAETVESTETATPTPPSGETRASFGSGTQFVLSLDRLAGVSVNFGHTESSGSSVGQDDTCSATSVSGTFFGSPPWESGACGPGGLGGVRWGADVFLGRGISVGGSMSFTSDSRDHTSLVFSPEPLKLSSKSFTISPRLGYAEPLGDHWTFWPRVGFDWLHAHVEFEELSPAMGLDINATQTVDLLDAGIDLRFVYSPVAHLALFGGPFATVPLWNQAERSDLVGGSTTAQAKAYELGLALGLLGYI